MIKPHSTFNAAVYFPMLHNGMPTSTTTSRVYRSNAATPLCTESHCIKPRVIVDS